MTDQPLNIQRRSEPFEWTPICVHAIVAVIVMVIQLAIVLVLI